MGGNHIISKISEIQKCIEVLRKHIADDPGKSENILTEALLEIQHGLEDLSTADVDEVQPGLKEESNDSRERLEALHRYKLLSDNSRDIILFMRKDGGRILEANAAATKAYGYSREELLNLTIHDLRAPESRALTDDQMDQAEAEGILFETVHRRQDGSLFPVEVSSEGAIVRGTHTLISVVRDISERRRAIRTIESLAKFPDENPNPVMRISANGFIIYANQSSAELLGRWGCQMGQALPDIYRNLIAKTLGSGNSSEIDVETGETVYSLVFAPIASGGYVNIYGKDITERKKIEMELHKAHEVLEQKVLERTAELSLAKEEVEVINEELLVEIEEHKQTEDALLKAKDAAEAAAQVKSDFMANMSHEIRTPMNAVIGMTSILLDDGNLDPEQQDFIETIRINGDALMVIINDILDFSKMERDKAVLEEQPFELRSCVEEALDLVANSATEKGLNLAYTIDKGVPESIIGDPTRLRQILGNLLNNAVKFTDQGEVTLAISSRKLGTGHEIHFAVQDTGIGIPVEQIGRLFQPFAQVDAAVTRKYGGTGLGLAISRKLVEMMNGRIWVESLPGQGSTFHFTIQADTGPDERKTRPGVQPQLAGKSVLIVDNNRTNRRILGAYAYSWGMSPLIAASGKDALEWIQRGDKFDIAILDMNMPEMDGLTLAEKIRNYNRDMPLVMLTSMGQRIDSYLFDAKLFKPIKPAQLHKILINTILAQQSRKTIGKDAVKKEVDINPMKILLAEDNVSSQKVALQILKRLGYKADVVANGIEVCQAFERQPYDLVLMDVRMPEMDGLEATRVIRQRWPENGPKIVAITAYALEGDREKCLAAGMDDYISKPVKIDELAVALAKYQASGGPGRFE